MLIHPNKESGMPYDADDDLELFDNDMPVVSANECTGLIPAAPIDEQDAHSYGEIYDIPLSHNKTKKKKHTSGFRIGRQD